MLAYAFGLWLLSGGALRVVWDGVAFRAQGNAKDLLGLAGGRFAFLSAEAEQEWVLRIVTVTATATVGSSSVEAYKVRVELARLKALNQQNSVLAEVLAAELAALDALWTGHILLDGGGVLAEGLIFDSSWGA